MPASAPAAWPACHWCFHIWPINNIMRMPDVTARLTSLGLLPRSSASPDQAQAYIRSEFSAWGAVVKRSGTTLD